MTTSAFSAHMTTVLLTNDSRQFDVNDSLSQWPSPPTTTTSASVDVVTLFSTLLLLVCIGLPGLVLNVFQLLVMTSDSRFHNLKYTVHYALAGANIVMCVSLAVQLVDVVATLYHDTLQPYACYTSITVFLFSYVMSLGMTSTLALVYLRRWQDEPAAARAYVIKLSLCVLPVLLLSTGLIVTVNVTQGVCYSIPIGNDSSHVTPSVWLIGVNLLPPVAVVTLTLACVIGMNVRLAAYRRLCVVRSTPAALQVSVNDEPLRDTDSAQHYNDSTCVGAASDTSYAHSKESIARSASPKTITFQGDGKQPGDSDDDDDDSFDKRMRMRMRKPNSGRRHTVANIGVDDGLLGGKRRSSLEVPQRSPLASFSRKWSVDITALQAQLENPRHYGGSFPFNDLGILPAAATAAAAPEPPKFPSRELHTELPSHTEEDEHEDGDDTAVTSPPRESDQLLNDNATATVNGNTHSAATAAAKTATTVHKAADSNQHSGVPRSVNNSNHNDVTASTDISATTTSANHVTTEEATTAADADTWEGKLQTYDKETLRQNKEQQQQQRDGDADDAVCSIRKYQLRRCQALFCQLSYLCLLPYAVGQIVVSVLQLVNTDQPISGVTLRYLYLDIALCSVVSVFQPLYLLCAEPKLRRACCALWHSQWRCACYCNIGPGKKFFSKPRELNNGHSANSQNSHQLP